MCPGGELAFNTVQTLLRIMEDKGLVRHRAEGRTFVYEPTYSRDRVTSRLEHRVFDGGLNQVVLSLLQAKDAGEETSCGGWSGRSPRPGRRRRRGATGKGRAVDMEWQTFVWGRLADAAAGGLIVLAVGGLAARLCRQPVRRSPARRPDAPRGRDRPQLAWGPCPSSPGGRSGPSRRPLPPSRPIASDPSRPCTGPPCRPSRREQRGMPDLVRPSPETSTGSVSTAPTKPAPGSPLDGPRRPHVRARPVCRRDGRAGGVVVARAGRALAGHPPGRRIPVPGAVRDLFLGLTGPEGGRTMLLESDRIALPFTYTWARPVILLPATLCGGDEPRALRYVLAHEPSRVESATPGRGISPCLADLVLFYQPLFWWLRRQLRLCQDYSPTPGPSPGLGRRLRRVPRPPRAGPQVRAVFPGAGIGDRRYRTFTGGSCMLVQEREPLKAPLSDGLEPGRARPSPARSSSSPRRACGSTPPTPKAPP